MKGLLIDPAAQSVTSVDVPDGAIAEVIGCSYSDRVGLTPGEDLWIDDEGRYQYPHPHGYFRIGGALFCGRGLVLGHDGKGGTVSTRLATFQLGMHVEFVETPPLEDVEPGMTIIVVGGES